MSTSRFAGVIVVHGDDVALVRESRANWGGEFWNVPSGRVDEGESPAEGAARELAEESGLVVAPVALTLVSTVTTTTAGGLSLAWNFVAEVETDRLEVSDPEGLILAARWFPRAEAIGNLESLPYRPLGEPAVGYLTGRSEVGAHWTYEL